MTRLRSARLGMAAVVGAAALTACGSGTPSPVGDPDPGHRLMNALRPVAQSVPAGVRAVDRHFYEPVWDSCDGQRSTFGWDDVTVDIGFNSNGLPDDTVFTHIERVLASQGWTYEPRGSATGAWYWGRRLPNGRRASIQLLGGADTEPHNPWDLQATTAPATHPVRGC